MHQSKEALIHQLAVATSLILGCHSFHILKFTQAQLINKVDFPSREVTFVETVGKAPLTSEFRQGKTGIVAMGKDLSQVSNERYDHEIQQPKAAKIFFSSKFKLPIEEECVSSFHSTRRSRNVEQGKGREMFFARIAGGLPEDGVKWITENFNNVKLNVGSLSENFGGASFHGRAQRVSVAKKRGQRRQICFARVADKLEPETKERLEDLKEDIVEVAEEARVPVPSATLPYIGFIHSLTVKNLLCGILAGAVASTFVVPFDVVRTKLIAGQGGQTAGQVVSTVARNEGLQTLFKGSLAFNIPKNAIEKGLQFTTFEFVKRYQERNVGEQKKVFPLPKQINVATAGGAAAGLVGTFLSYPLQPVFDRLLLEPEKYSGMKDTLFRILREEGGVKELYRGITPALINIIPQAALSFYTYETLKKKYLTKQNLKPEIEALRSLIIGGVAGAVSTTVTYPLTLAMTELRMSVLPSSAVHFPGAGNVTYKNMWEALNGIVKTQGVNGLYRGLTAQTLQIVPMSAITFMVYELAKRAFVAVGEESRNEVKDVDDLEED